MICGIVISFKIAVIKLQDGCIAGLVLYPGGDLNVICLHKCEQKDAMPLGWLMNVR